jgi:PAS domain S-box-containing protein
MLDLDFLYARIRLDPHEAPIDALRTAPLYRTSDRGENVRYALNQWSGEHPEQWPGEVFRHLEGLQDISVFPLRMGIDGELGLIVAGSRRAGFPLQTERLILNVAANQTAVGLQQSLILTDQKRIASELDRRIAERTRELAQANQQLQLQVELLQHLPVIAWTLRPDGTPDFINQVWLDYSRQTLAFVCSRPEAWMTAVHPDDRETAARVFWDGVRSGQSFAMETRFLRAQDGAYRWHLNRAIVVRNTDGKVLRFVGTSTDIDDQKRAEEELRASETNLRQIVDSIPGLVCTMAATGEIEQLNRPLLEYFGKLPAELKGWKMTDAVHPDDLPEVVKAYTYSIATGTPYDIEHRCRRGDGVYRWFQVRALAVRDTDSNICGWYVLLTDIEDRKRAEDALRASENNFRQIVDSIPGLISTLSADGQIDLVSQQALEYFGMTREQLTEWATNGAIHPDDVPHVTSIAENAFTTGASYDMEHRCRRADGVYRWFHNRALPVHDADGDTTGWYVLLTDIDDRKRAENELKRSEARYRVVVETASDAVVSIDESGTIILANPATKRIFGFDTEELVGKPLTVLMPGAMRNLHQAGLNRYLATGKRHLNWQGTEVTALRANGEEFPAEVSFGEMTVDQQRIFTGFIRDISEKKRAEEELHDTQAELARMMRVMTIGQLTASIAHEVSQPLSGIITNTNTCVRMLNSDPPDVGGALETAQRTLRDGKRATDVIARLRTLLSKRQINIEPVDVNEAAREVLALLSGELQKRDLLLLQQFSDNLPRVMGDRVQLQQVILNLLRNASDAMKTISDRQRRLLIRTEADNNSVRVSVQDSGVGFDPRIADRLFESFFTTKQEGMGIGLSVSRSIVEAHRGKLWATRNEGPGATFAFSIPYADAPSRNNGN